MGISLYQTQGSLQLHPHKILVVIHLALELLLASFQPHSICVLEHQHCELVQHGPVSLQTNQICRQCHTEDTENIPMCVLHHQLQIPPQRNSKNLRNIKWTCGELSKWISKDVCLTWTRCTSSVSTEEITDCRCHCYCDGVNFFTWVALQDVIHACISLNMSVNILYLSDVHVEVEVNAGGRSLSFAWDGEVN